MEQACSHAESCESGHRYQHALKREQCGASPEKPCTSSRRRSRLKRHYAHFRRFWLFRRRLTPPSPWEAADGRKNHQELTRAKGQSTDSIKRAALVASRLWELDDQ